MKTIILSLLVLTGFVVNSYSQAKDSLYLVTYTTGSLWNFEKQPHEQPYFKEHGARLGQLRKDGIIRFGARSGEKGIIVIEASSLTAAREIVRNDVAVANRLFEANVQRLNIFYSGCLETPK